MRKMDGVARRQPLLFCLFRPMAPKPQLHPGGTVLSLRTPTRLLHAIVPTSMQPQKCIFLQHVIARRLVAKRTLGKFSACHCKPVHGGPAKGYPLRGEKPQGSVAPPVAFGQRGAWRTLGRREVWQSASPQEQETVYSTLGKFAAPFVFALSATLCYVLPQEKRIATSLRSSQ